jgi:hypothetical protein
MIAGQYSQALPHIYPVAGFALLVLLGAVLLFLRQMKRQ